MAQSIDMFVKQNMGITPTEFYKVFLCSVSLQRLILESGSIDSAKSGKHLVYIWKFCNQELGKQDIRRFNATVKLGKFILST